jgi:hypothetical protein
MLTVQICARCVNEYNILVYVASIIMGYGGSNPGRDKSFSSSLKVQTCSRSLPASYSKSARGLCPGRQKRPGREADDTSISYQC